MFGSESTFSPLPQPASNTRPESRPCPASSTSTGWGLSISHGGGSPAYQLSQFLALTFEIPAAPTAASPAVMARQSSPGRPLIRTDSTLAPMGGNVLFSPPADLHHTTEIGRFMPWLGEHRGREVRSYDELWAWSVGDLEGFWSAIWDSSARARGAFYGSD